MKGIFIALILVSFKGVAEQPVGRFHSDTITVGAPVDFSLTMKYPLNWQVIFPDSNASYYPFEVIDIRYFETRSDSLWSFDSAVYTFLSFELDSVQSLSLPVSIIKEKDSFSIPSIPEKVVLMELIPEISDTVSVRTYTEPALLQVVFNYPKLFWALGITLAVILVVVVFFGGRIYVSYQKFLLGRRHGRFLKEMDEYLQNAFELPSKQKVESIEVFWKRYMESISEIRYSAMTTREISILENHENISACLKSLDNFSYGDVPIGNWKDVLMEFKHFAEDHYFKRIESLKRRK